MIYAQGISNPIGTWVGEEELGPDGPTGRGKITNHKYSLASVGVKSAFKSRGE